MILERHGLARETSPEEHTRAELISPATAAMTLLVVHLQFARLMAHGPVALQHVSVSLLSLKRILLCWYVACGVLLMTLELIQN